MRQIQRIKIIWNFNLILNSISMTKCIERDFKVRFENCNLANNCKIEKCLLKKLDHIMSNKIIFNFYQLISHLDHNSRNSYLWETIEDLNEWYKKWLWSFCSLVSGWGRFQFRTLVTAVNIIPAQEGKSIVGNAFDKISNNIKVVLATLFDPLSPRLETRDVFIVSAEKIITNITLNIWQLIVSHQQVIGIFFLWSTLIIPNKLSMITLLHFRNWGLPAFTHFAAPRRASLDFELFLHKFLTWSLTVYITTDNNCLGKPFLHFFT